MKNLGRSAAAEPEALALAVGLTLSGASSLLADHPGSLSAALPWWLRAVWSVVLVVGGGLRVIGLAGRWFKRTGSWAALDAAGCWLLVSVTAIYGTALVLLGRRGLISGLIVLAIGAACLLRARAYGRLHRALPGGEQDGDG